MYYSTCPSYNANSLIFIFYSLLHFINVLHQQLLFSKITMQIRVRASNSNFSRHANFFPFDLVLIMLLLFGVMDVHRSVFGMRCNLHTNGMIASCKFLCTLFSVDFVRPFTSCVVLPWFNSQSTFSFCYNAHSLLASSLLLFFVSSL